MKLLITSVLALTLSSCAWLESYQTQIQDTAWIVSKRVALIATNIVLHAAVSSYDADTKQDFLDGVSAGFRSLETEEIIKSEDVKAMVTAWTPNKPHWNNLADRFASEWDRLAPKTTAESALFAEAFAKGLNMTRNSDGKLITIL